MLSLMPLLGIYRAPELVLVLLAFSLLSSCWLTVPSLGIFFLSFAFMLSAYGLSGVVIRTLRLPGRCFYPESSCLFDLPKPRGFSFALGSSIANSASDYYFPSDRELIFQPFFAYFSLLFLSSLFLVSRVMWDSPQSRLHPSPIPESSGSTSPQVLQRHRSPHTTFSNCLPGTSSFRILFPTYPRTRVRRPLATSASSFECILFLVSQGPSAR